MTREAMSLRDDGFALLLPESQHWRESNIMKIPNTNLLDDLGGADHLGGRLWRLPPYSANTWHRHVDSWEFYFLLEGLGRMCGYDDSTDRGRHGAQAADRLSESHRVQRQREERLGRHHATGAKRVDLLGHIGQARTD